MNMTDNSTSPNFTPSKSTELYVVMGFLTILSVVGTVGNFLVLYVFAQKKDRLTSTIFILALAFVDLTTCMVIVPFTVYMEYIKFRTRIDIICKIYQGLITSTIPFSALLMAAIAVDRYFCICHPFLHVINIRRAKFMCVFLGLIAATLGVITGLAFGVYSRKETCHEIENPFEILMKSPTNTTMEAAGFQISNSSPFPGIGNESEISGPMNFSGVSLNSTLHKKRRDCVVAIYMQGVCDQNLLIVNDNFMWIYHKIYTALFLVVLIIISMLYVLIYNSVMRRRKKRQKQKKHLPAIPMHTTTAEPRLLSDQTQTTTTTINGNVDAKNGSTNENKDKELQPLPAPPQRNRKTSKSKKDRNRVANVKTAAMLFVVTVVFVITYLPAFLMALDMIVYNMTVFYMYFANNVANPIIYSFMNKNFRDDLKKIFNCI